MYEVSKTYGHDLGISAAFRQWRADSHCSKIHGYALAFTIVFEAAELDERGWVIDFGGLKPLKQFIIDTFDHRLLVAKDDPELVFFKELHNRRLADVVIFEDGVGCEKFARTVLGKATALIENLGLYPRVRVKSVECREHGANAATIKTPRLF